MIKLLQSHASKDETRYHLTGVYFDTDHAIATDGYRMIKVKFDDDLELSQIATDKKKKIYSFKEHQTIDGKFPNCESYFGGDKKNPYVLMYQVPEWMKSVKPKKSSAVFVTEDGLQFYKPTHSKWVSINIGFLAPYAGHDLKITWKDNLSPVSVWNDKFEAVIMPMKV